MLFCFIQISYLYSSPSISNMLILKTAPSLDTFQNFTPPPTHDTTYGESSVSLLCSQITRYLNLLQRSCSLRGRISHQSIFLTRLADQLLLIGDLIDNWGGKQISCKLHGEKEQWKTFYLFIAINCHTTMSCNNNVNTTLRCLQRLNIWLWLGVYHSSPSAAVMFLCYQRPYTEKFTPPLVCLV